MNPGQQLTLADSVQVLGAQMDLMGLKLSRDITPENYEALCLFLGSAHESLKFAIGDAIVQGEELFGEEMYGYTESLGLSEQQRWQYIRVAEMIPRSRRMEGLSWSHHRVVCSMKDAADQSMWLKRAKKEKWSKVELEEAIKAEKGGSEKTKVREHERRSPMAVERIIIAAGHVRENAELQDDGSYIVPEGPMAELEKALE